MYELTNEDFKIAGFIARKEIRKRRDPLVNLEDGIQNAAIGLIIAAEKYDPTPVNNFVRPFWAYAVKFVRGYAKGYRMTSNSSRKDRPNDPFISCFRFEKENATATWNKKFYKRNSIWIENWIEHSCDGIEDRVVAKDLLQKLLRAKLKAPGRGNCVNFTELQLRFIQAVYFEGKTIPEFARESGVSESTLEKTPARIRNKLRKRYKLLTGENYNEKV